MVTTPNYDLDIDTTLGGSNASDYIIPSQKAIKSYVDNNSGGSGTVDQTYTPTSANAQSGVAIAGAGFLQNTATGTNALTILGITNNKNYSVLIGEGTTAGSEYNTVIGNTATGNGTYATALGYYARANAQYTTAIGHNSYAHYNDSTAIGHSAETSAAGTLAVGSGAKATAQFTTSIGYSSQATKSGAISLGYYAKATAIGALQIGEGTNNTANTLQVGTYTLLDTSTGLIPDARISSNIARTSAIPDISTKQDTLVSGTNIKTINNTSILGSGNIDTKEIFVAEYNVTSYADVISAYNSGKIIICKYTDNDGIDFYAPHTAYITNIAGTMLEFQFDRFYISISSETGWYIDTEYYRLLATAQSSTDTTNLPISTSYFSIANNRLLDKTTGLIPDARISSNIARTSNVADTDLSNLSATGKTVIDGQWVKKSAQLSSSTAVGSYNLTNTLKTELPDDNYNYEILLNVQARTTGSSTCNLGTALCDAETVLWLSANSRSAASYIILPVDSNRTLTQTNGGSAFAALGIALHAYKRLGTNT